MCQPCSLQKFFYILVTSIWYCLAFEQQKNSLKLLFSSWKLTTNYYSTQYYSYCMLSKSFFCKQHSHLAKNTLKHQAEITIRMRKYFVFLSNKNYLCSRQSGQAGDRKQGIDKCLEHKSASSAKLQVQANIPARSNSQQ